MDLPPATLSLYRARAEPGRVRGGSRAHPALRLRLRGVVKAARLRRHKLLGSEEEEGVELLCGSPSSCQPTAAGLTGCP